MLRLAAGAALVCAAQPLSAQTALVSEPDPGEIILVFGRGESRQVNELRAEEVRLLAPGSTPFKAIEKLPGVNFQSADPFGAYEWSTRVTLRGFNQNQLGFTLDGLPLGDMSYANNNGLHVSRATISDNIASIRVSQGAGALGTASTSNLGGTIAFLSRDPGETPDVAANGSIGSENTGRVFARLETGRLGPVRGYVSYAYLDAVKWKGEGAQRHHQANAKLVADAGERATLTAFLNFSDRRENDYQDLSLEMIRRLGYGWDNFRPDWRLAVRVAHIARNRGDVGGGPTDPSAGRDYPPPITSVDDAYYDASGLRRDWLGGVRLEVRPAAALSLSVHPYYHSNEGQGIWFTPYVATPGGAPISVRTTEYDIRRWGIVSDVGLTLGRHRISGGVWYEDNDFTHGRRFYGLANADFPSRDSLKFQRDPFFTQWRMKFNTRTIQVHLQDSWEVLDTLTIDFGFKGNRVENTSAIDVRTGRNPAAGTISSEDWFLPQLGFVARPAPSVEFFGNYTENYRAFVSSATSGPFSTTQAGFDAIRANLRPETSRTFEGGIRFAAGDLSGVAAIYHVDFRNRLLAIPTGPGIVGNPVVLQNVGSVRSRGLEVALVWRISDDLRVFGSYSHNDSTYRDDVVNASGQVVARIRGKRVVDTPADMLKGEIAYEPPSGPFARAGVNWMSRRFFTFTNDQSVGSRALVDVAAGWRLGGEGWARGLAIQGSVTNLFDISYVATIGSNGFGNSGDNQTLLAGAPRQWFVTLRRDF